MAHSDKQEHLALVLRTLGIDEDCWRRFVEEFFAECSSGMESLAQKIVILKRDWDSVSPHEAPRDDSIAYDHRCPVCGAAGVGVIAARRQVGDFPLIYGLCENCGLGILLGRPNEISIYGRPEYSHSRHGQNIRVRGITAGLFT